MMAILSTEVVVLLSVGSRPIKQAEEGGLSVGRVSIIGSPSKFIGKGNSET